MVAAYLFWVTKSRNISFLGRAKSHKISSVAQNRKTPILSRSGHNIPDLGRNGRNIAILSRNGRNIPFLSRAQSQHIISGSRKVA